MRNSFRFALVGLIIYLLAPLVAGTFPDGDRRGPRIYWIEYHELLFTFSHEFLYGQKPRPLPWGRGWFYGMKGKEDRRLMLLPIYQSFEQKVPQVDILAARDIAFEKSKGKFPMLMPRAQWPVSFATNGLLAVRAERYGTFIVLERDARHEGGMFVLTSKASKDEVEKALRSFDGYFGENGIYLYVRELD